MTSFVFYFFPCPHSEQGGNKPSGRCSLFPPPPHQGKGTGGKGRETYTLGIKTASLIILITRETMQNTPHRPRGRRAGSGALASHPRLPGSTRKSRTGFAADGNWTQECTDRNPDQDRRQDKEQSPIQQAARDEECETLVIPPALN